MSFTENKGSTPDEATQAFWRAAETGNVDELVSVLPRVRDINARNEHGVTALMRAAQHGRLRVVRVLLERGADANIIRNDKFTALALAAFFGHTEVVRALMEHGADSQASTRHGTSPHMWATARTFNEVVDELDSPAQSIEKASEKLAPPVEKSSAVAERPAPPPSTLVEPVSRAVARAAANATVIRTLKDPPEIWDLVHTAPKGFNARSAFVARFNSMRRGFAFRAVMVVVLASVCAIGVWVLRGVQARSEPNVDRESNRAAATVVSAPSTRGTTAAVPNALSAADPAIDGAVDPSAAWNAPTPPSSNRDAVTSPAVAVDKPVFTRKRSSQVNSHGSEQPSNVATNDVSQPVVLPTAKTSPQIRSQQVTTPGKNKAALSPQMIAPVNNATPKAKVIQWP